MDDIRIISTKGQVVIPKNIREYMNVNEGDMLQFVIKESGEVMVTPVKNRGVMDLFGALPPKNADETKDLEKVILDSKIDREARRGEEGKS